MRAKNAIDFWRGLALVMIFIDHVPGSIYTYWTLQNFAISDAAELFVLLAGWSLCYATADLAKKKDGSGYLATDKFHLNDLGYRCMAQYVARAIVVGILNAEADPASQQAGETKPN